MKLARLFRLHRLGRDLTQPSDTALVLNQRLTRSGYSLTVKLALSITGLILLSIGSITWLSVRREQQAFKVELEQQADLLLDTLGVATSDWLYFLEVERLSALMEALQENNSLLLSGQIYDADGRIIADIGNTGDLMAIDPYGQQLLNREGTQFEWQADRLMAGRRVVAGRQPLGAISISLSTELLEAKLIAVRQRSLVVTLLTVLAGATIALILSRSITRPLRTVMTATRRIAAGDLSKRVEVRSSDEFAVLADAFNAMTQQLQNTLAEREKTDLALRESQERFALAVQGANDGLWDWNLRTSQIYFSPRWKEMLGYGPDDMRDRLPEWFDRVHPDDVDVLKSAIADHLQHRTRHLQVEYRMRHREGHYLWILSRGVAIRDRTSAPYRMAGSQTDITLRKEAESRLFYEAFHDSLTGLPNRSLLLQRLRQVVERSRGDLEFQFAVLFLDFDRFKVINDSLGHNIGDELLLGIAKRIQKSLREIDLFARLGGDEFVILLEGIHQVSDATEVADRIQRQLMQPFRLSGHDIIITASIGIVVGNAQYTSPDDILRDADISMYWAKEQGKARYAVFHPKMHDDTLNRLQIENDLRDAIARQEFSLQYQPIVNLKSGRVAGFEALIRWRRQQQGWISPCTFIPLAEETGLIVPIGTWVLEEACRQAYQWMTAESHNPAAGCPTVSVNLSINQIVQADLIDCVVQLLAQTRLPASQLKVEITESIIMENLDLACLKLEALRHMGVQVYLDDFGTGYASLGYLQKLPIDALKIDRTFVSKIGVDRGSEEILKTIIQLGKGLHIDIIAEGVETIEQQAWLQNLDCDYAQGFLFSQPLDAATLNEFIQREQRASQTLPPKWSQSPTSET